MSFELVMQIAYYHFILPQRIGEAHELPNQIEFQVSFRTSQVFHPQTAYVWIWASIERVRKTTARITDPRLGKYGRPFKFIQTSKMTKP